MNHILQLNAAIDLLDNFGFFLHHASYEMPQLNYNEDMVVSACESALKQIGTDYIILSSTNCPLCGEMFDGLKYDIPVCHCMTDDQVTKFIARHRKD